MRVDDAKTIFTVIILRLSTYPFRARPVPIARQPFGDNLQWLRCKCLRALQTQQERDLARGLQTVLFRIRETMIRLACKQVEEHIYGGRPFYPRLIRRSTLRLTLFVHDHTIV